MVTRTFETIETERLRLRRFRTEDAPALAAYRADADVARYQGWEAGYPVAEAERFVAEMASAGPGEPGGWFQVAVADPETDALLGDCVIHTLGAPTPRWVEIGYTIAPRYQGRGYAKEAARAVIAFAFDELGVERVRAIVDARNAASIAVASSIGMTRVGSVHTTFKGEPCQEFTYELTRS